MKWELVGTGLALVGIGLALMLALPPPGWPKMPPNLVHAGIISGLVVAVVGTALALVGMNAALHSKPGPPILILSGILLVVAGSAWFGLTKARGPTAAPRSSKATDATAAAPNDSPTLKIAPPPLSPASGMGKRVAPKKSAPSQAPATASAAPAGDATTEDRSKYKTPLQEFYVETVALLNEISALPKDEQIAEAQLKVEALSKRTEVWLGANMGPAAVAKYITLHEYVYNLPWAGDHNDMDIVNKRARMIDRLRSRIANLEALMGTDRWDPPPEPSRRASGLPLLGL